MRYVTTLIVSALAVLALAAAFNAWFDPFGVWRSYAETESKPNYLRMKPGIDNDPRFAKPLQVINLKPKTIIVGSSRVRDGMDPALLTGLAPAPIMNYGTAGMRATEGARFIRHAIDVADVRCIIWGLDFFGFNDREMDEMGSDRFGVLQPHFRAHDMGRLLLAWPTLDLSADMTDNKAITRANGFNLAPATPAEAIDASIMRNAVGFAKAPFLYGKFDSFSQHMQEVESALAYATAKGVKVYLYTSPLHGMVIEAVFQAGADQAFLRWKREIASLARKYHIPLVDYMNYSSITTTKGRAAAEFFFDGAHFTPAVSRMILGQWFPVDSRRPADFGVALTPDAVGSEWGKLLMDRDAYIAANKKQVDELIRQLH